ncbi:Putative 2-hydroxyacid dehydrogenase SA2098,Glyoxylate reductase,Glyoxylate reductase/hydroxypyruvate reductase,Putative 2-hydroxyacid dehydrogenase SAR2389,Putative 2-hydroxyacid dehydrogenase SACOL2296,Putative 2-hydroxyacid dehydrogenase SAB2178 [Acanthosepion pharaonis]|uniref:Uncharacterized protein n=1 Tax=Acanthosepion pharaonis TaxID=158019 RepID=A0A812BIK1_ACAPH|nr:Putative 2-hydroxyacid dehydrogenase SA2098,Glyoxylate reductase,Glyoxylate reductase/hydroxypyruvate reductase,Putative 2-hydroxyacid dehydrogenase SAR2389,Putative 2-hydroxyacid dehydrogenase SACOL2296,Putative 2-hydroxyacid dehydrogenase SAB2178 [Sepia pharaonis]
MASQKKPHVLLLLEYYIHHEEHPSFRHKCLERLERSFKVVFPSDLAANPGLATEIFGAITPGGEEENRRLLRSLPNLKIISNHGVGIDHIDLKWAKNSNIRIGNTKPVVANATADLAMALLLASARKIIPGVRYTMGNDMPYLSPPEYTGHCLTDATIGILGMGNIGLKIAIRAKAFNMTVLYHNRNRRSSEDENLIQAKYFARLKDMLPECDYLVIACPATNETTNMIGWPEFKAMKNTSYLINIGRGKIVDHDALVKALTTEEIAAAALDVTFPEPLPRNHPLLSLPNVIITPHCGTNTFETRYKMIDLVAQNLECALEGKPMPSEVDL